MATINEITSGSQYTGNAALGGGNFGVGQLDTKPVEDLARYTFLYNRAEFEQRQKDVEKAASEISELVSYDITSGIPKDSKVLQDKYDKLLNYVRDNPDALDYRNKKAWAEYNKMRNDLENDIRSGKVRNVMNAVREQKIAEEKDPKVKALLQKELDAEIDKTDIRTPLNHDQQYDDSMPAMPDASELTFDVMQKGPNQIFDREYKMFNVSAARAKSNVFAMGLNETIDESTPEGKRKAIARKGNFWVDGSEIFNSALAGYKNPDGTIDESRMKGRSRDIYNLVKETNKYMAEKRNEIKAGIYKDKMGRDINFGQGAIKEEDYQEINVQDGISPDELALVAQYAKWKGDAYNTKAIQTNDQIEMARISETARHNKATEGLAGASLKFEEDKWKASMTGGETIKNGAMERAKRLYSDMQKLTDEYGVISPDKVRQLNQEQLKYMGIEKVTMSAGDVAKSVFTPLTFKDDKGNNVPVAIQLINGEIKVLSEPSKLPSGAYKGTWDNSKSTNVYNIATNIVNEELQKAGAKELNAYMPIDFGTGGVSTNTTGGSTSISGGAQKKRVYKGLDAKGNPIFEEEK